MKVSASTPAVGVRLRLAALAASTLLAVSPVLQAGPPAPQTSTGTIKGKLIWDAGPVPKPKVESAAANNKDAVCKANPILNKDITVDPETKGVADAFAYLITPTADPLPKDTFKAREKELNDTIEAAAKALIAKTPAVVVDQVNCEYVPYATVVHKDQKLTFKSSDPVGHNVEFKPFSNTQINPMLPPNGSYPYTIKKAESRPAAATCSIHPWMKGWVFIVDNPFAVVTKPDGSFEIKDVPAGEQHLIVWQSSKGYVTANRNKGMAVTVKAGETTDVGPIKITK